MKDKYDWQSLFGLLCVAFLLGFLVGGSFVKRYMGKIESTKSKCSCVCCGGADNDN